MSQRVAVVGVEQTPYRQRYDTVMLEELIFRTIRSFLDRNGLSMNDIDNVVIASSDMTDGRAISSMVTGGSAGSVNRDMLNLSSSAEHAFLLAAMQIMSGQYGLTLVASWSKTSESPMSEVDRLACEPYFTRRFGLNTATAAALEAASYMARYRPERDSILKIAVKNRENALSNPLAHLRERVGLEQLKASPVASWPLKEAELPPLSDGVCVMLLASEEQAKRFAGPMAWIRGMGWATDTFWIGERNLGTIRSLEIAAGQAYKHAGITRPLEQIDFAELQETSTFNEALQYEALGFCEAGGSARLIEEGVVWKDGKLPVNMSGGTLSANPTFCSGLVRIAETALQVMGQAGERQLPKADVGLATCVSGFASQSGTVVILSGE